MKFLRAGGTLAPYAPASLVVAVAAVASLAMPRSAVAEPTSNADVEQLLASAEVDIGNAVVDLRNIEIKGQVEQADELTQDALREVKHTIAVLHRAAHEPSPASSPKHAQFAGNSSAPPSAGAAPPATSTAVAERSTPAASHEASQPGENQPVGTRISDAQSAREQTAPGQPTAGGTSSGGSSGTTAAPTSTAPPLVGVSQAAAATSPTNNTSGRAQTAASPSPGTSATPNSDSPSPNSASSAANGQSGHTSQPAGTTQSENQTTAQPGGTSSAPASGTTNSGTTGSGNAAASSASGGQQAQNAGGGASQVSDNTIAPEAARKYIGQSVQDADGQSLGSLQDITKGQDGQTIAVIAYGGFLGLFQSHAAIPWKQAKPHLVGPQLVFDMTPSQVQEAPRYAAR